MKILLKAFLVIIAILLLNNHCLAGEVIERVYNKKSFEGSKSRQYSLFTPSDYSAEEPLPLVVVLHGCNQTHKDIMNDTQFNELAEKENFLVAYPFVTSYDGLRGTNCWGFWFENEIHQGRGEVADIAGIIREIQGAYKIDSNQIHITGLSSGGALATAVMVAYSEIISSGAPAAGIAYGETACAVRGVCFTLNMFDPKTYLDWWGPTFESSEQTALEMSLEMGEDKRMVPLLLLHATDDPKVSIDAAKNNAAAWAKLFDIKLDSPVSSETGQTDNMVWHHKRYGSYGTRSAIETHFVKGPGHVWVGGAQGTYAVPDGPDWSVIAWNFFKTHPMVEQ